MAKLIKLDEIVEPTAKLFGSRLRERRQQLGKTLAEVEAQTGISATYISLVERGRANPTLDAMVKLADAIDCPVGSMLTPD